MSPRPARQTLLTRLPATEPEALGKALGIFSLWLSTPDVISSPRLCPLSSPLLSGRVHRGALRRLIRAYNALCEEAHAESARGKYVAGSVVLGRERPFGQVALLRQICGLEEDDSGRWGDMLNQHKDRWSATSGTPQCKKTVPHLRLRRILDMHSRVSHPANGEEAPWASRAPLLLSMAASVACRVNMEVW